MGLVNNMGFGTSWVLNVFRLTKLGSLSVSDINIQSCCLDHVWPSHLHSCQADPQQWPGRSPAVATAQAVTSRVARGRGRTKAETPGIISATPK